MVDFPWNIFVGRGDVFMLLQEVYDLLQQLLLRDKEGITAEGDRDENISSCGWLACIL